VSKPGFGREALVSAAMVAWLAACGGKDLCLNCPSGTPTPPGQNTVTVTGNIFSSSPPAPGSVMELICVGLSRSVTIGQCGQASAGGTLFLVNNDASGNFTRTGVTAGSERIGFWFDQNNNGNIDPGEVVELTDSSGQLGNVAGGSTVTIADASVTFPNATLPNGSATATITVTAGTPTPQPTETPAPSNT
jgi:hypothetical protein